uniref:Putative procyclic form surface glycoprotein n=1 Tax=Trypanosoma vivax (strain Y486) TaxID=1055687 RepID=G0U835_TRYVY|nr:putative procyclic form surface glycoprotein [Trypanosoma vivax Y486]
MCLMDLVESIDNCFKSAVACLCFLVIGGPVLIAIGVLFLRHDDGENEFKEALKAFNPESVSHWSGFINGHNASLRRGSLNVPGYSGVPTRYVTASVVYPPVGAKNLRVEVDIRSVERFSRSVPLAVRSEKTYSCYSSDCDKYSSSKCRCTKENDKFRRKCEANGGKYSPTVTDCSLGHQCSTCTQRVYLNTVYLVAEDIGNGKFRESSRYASATHPMGSRSGYSSRRGDTIEVRLYSDKDPLVALEHLTHGRGEFGLGNRTIGIAAIVFGSLLILLEICACAVMICFCMKRKESAGQASGEDNDEMGYSPSNGCPPPAPGGYPGVTYGQPPPTQQPGFVYGQPLQTQQPGYGYGQPPPPQQPGYSYGQPPLPPPQQPGYGEPPPPQQPGYSYGQPPPPQQPGYSYGQPPPQQPGYSYGQPPPQQPGYGYGQPPPPLTEPIVANPEGAGKTGF